MAACASTVDAAASGVRARMGAAGSGAVTGIDPGDGNADADSGTASTAGGLIDGAGSSRAGRDALSGRPAASYAGGVGAGRVGVWTGKFGAALLPDVLLFGALLFARLGPIGGDAEGAASGWAPR